MADLGPQRAWMDPQVCGFNPLPERSPDGDCGRDAVVHIRLNTAAEGFIAACAEHKRFALRMPHYDHHQWSPWCEIPGALWHPSPTPDEADSFCALDDSGEDPSLVRRADLMLTNTGSNPGGDHE